MVNRVAFIANGPLADSQDLVTDLLAEIRSHDIIVAVDGGVNHCHQLGVVPNLIIGDFDSVIPSLLSFYSDVETIRFPREKDKTDLQIAIEKVVVPSVSVWRFGRANRSHSIQHIASFDLSRKTYSQIFRRDSFCH
jgi:thiamine pyrophosphokinase